MTAFKGDSKVMKLFAKHIKVSEGLWFLVRSGSNASGPLPGLSFFASAALPYLLSQRVLWCLPYIFNTQSDFLCIPCLCPHNSHHSSVL